MRSQDHNPMYQHYSHLLAKSRRYYAKHVDIFWNVDESGKVREVEVVFIPRRDIPKHREDGGVWAEYRRYNKRWRCDLGNSCSDWLQPGEMSPESIFGHFLQIGFANYQELLRAVEEFGHIEECEWARKMLRGLPEP